MDKSKGVKVSKYIKVAVIIGLLLGLSFMLFRAKPAVPLTESEVAVCGQGEGCTISEKRVQGFNVGDQIPNLELQKFDGQTVSLYDQLAGKDKFILSLAVDWCSDCERQDEKLNQYYKLLPENYGAAVVFVDYSSADGTKTTNKAQANEYVDAMDYVFPTFWDEGNKIANDFGGVLATPTNIVLDENGIIKAKTEEIDMDILFGKNNAEYDPAIISSTQV